MTDGHAFDTMIASGKQWLHELMATLELPPDEEGQGLRALRAGLHAIRDRLPAAEAVDLGAQLPSIVRGIYYEGWSPNNDPTRIHDRADMLARVEHELAPDARFSPIAVLTSVIALLKHHVSPGEIADVVATLPRPIAKLWAS